MHPRLAGTSARKEWIIRQYDHEVQGASVLKPLVGVANDGPGDAAVIAPVLGSRRGVAVSNGINPKYGDIDPYAMAASAIDEAVRQIISVGGDARPHRAARQLLLGQLRQARQRSARSSARRRPATTWPRRTARRSSAARTASTTSSASADESIAIPPTLLISAVGVLRDVRKCVSMDAKKAGNILYVVGMTYDEMGGSHYYALENYVGNHAPIVRPEQAPRHVRGAFARHRVRASSAPATTAPKAASPSPPPRWRSPAASGMDLYTLTVPRPPEIARDDVILFSESNSRFLCEVAPEKSRGVRVRPQRRPHRAAWPRDGRKHLPSPRRHRRHDHREKHRRTQGGLAEAAEVVRKAKKQRIFFARAEWA